MNDSQLKMSTVIYEIIGNEDEKLDDIERVLINSSIDYSDAMGGKNEKRTRG